jgi:hypothetical protein
MGADLLYSFNEIQATKEQALANAKYLFDRNPLRDIVQELEDACGISRWWGDEHEDISPDDVLAFLNQCVEDVYSAINRRDCGVMYVDETRPFYFTAGMSWGDTPSDVYDSFVVCQNFGLTLNPEVAKPEDK